MKKVIMPIILVFILAFSLIGCGKSTSPAIGEGVVVSTEESSIEAEEKEILDGKGPAIGKLEEEVTNPTVKPTTEMTTTPEPESTEPPHVHEYKVESSTEATCATKGRVVKVCDCGDTKTEEVPATGNHDWKEVTTVVNHPELGHVEQVQVGVTEGYTIYECAACGYQDTSPLSDHRAAYVGIDRAHATARTYMYDHPGEPIYEMVFVVDTPEWEETVVTGYTCSICGATK